MDLTVVAIPAYFASMGAEYVHLRRKAEREGPTAATYERHDTVTSLTMGVGSLLVPLVVPKLVRPFTPGVGRYGKALVVGAVGAAAVTTAADLLARLDPGPEASPEGATPAERVADGAGAPHHRPAGPVSSTSRAGEPVGRRRRRALARVARKVARVGGVAAVAAGGVAITTTIAHRTRMSALWEKRLLPDLGTGPLAWAVAIAGWDAIYYWNHRLMHEARFMWAIHVVHHSSEHYNLSTALRQPVADVLGTFVPYGALSLVGVRPHLVMQARALNLLYQYWIHTDTIRTLGPFEEVLNTASHHRVHHGSNRQYLDRNHGSILIVWDRLFGTFEREDEPVVYGLTKNIETFNPLRVATHEHADILRDVADSTTWRDRLSFVVRSPGWAYERRAELDAAATTPEEAPTVEPALVAG
jgi:sterol desaturase/sphingolipid hydroxylase (fatty acid hydroxylase superfamily)